MKRRPKKLAIYKTICILLAIAAIVMIPAASLAASVAQTQAADALFTLGLFKGTGTDDQGHPQYSLDRAPTRMEGVVLLVRFLGKEAEALKEDVSSLPFSDVPDWGEPYAAYAYRTGLTNGVTEDRFGAESAMPASQYLTFLLRALGYKDGTDFQWDKAWELTDKLGITNKQFDATHTTFTRGDAVTVSVSALSAEVQGLGSAPKTLLAVLAAQGTVTEAAIKKAGLESSLYIDGVKPSPSVSATPAPSPGYYQQISIAFRDFGTLKITLQNAYSAYEYDRNTGVYYIYLSKAGTVTFNEDIIWNGLQLKSGETYKITDVNGLEIVSGNGLYSLVFGDVSAAGDTELKRAVSDLDKTAILDGPEVNRVSSVPVPLPTPTPAPSAAPDAQ